MPSRYTKVDRGICRKATTAKKEERMTKIYEVDDTELNEFVKACHEKWRMWTPDRMSVRLWLTWQKVKELGGLSDDNT